MSSSLAFGGALPPILDSLTGRAITLRCFGQLELDILDPVAFEQATAPNGGEEGFAAWLKTTILQQLGVVVEATGNLFKALRDVAPLIAEVAQRTNGAIAGIGASISISSLNLNMSEDDRDAMMQAARAAATQR